MRAATVVAVVAACAYVVPPSQAVSIGYTDPAVDRLASRTTSWAERATGVELQDRRVILLSPGEAIPGAEPWVVGMVPPGGGVTYISAEKSTWVVRLARSPWPVWEPGSAAVLLHELLHRHIGSGQLEEAATDAMVRDLWAAWCADVVGVDPPLPPIYYQSLVVGLNGASRIATGSARVDDRAARAWRRAFYAADPQRREAMIRRAESIRDTILSRGRPTIRRGVVA